MGVAHVVYNPAVLSSIKRYKLNISHILSNFDSFSFMTNVKTKIQKYGTPVHPKNIKKTFFIVLWMDV